MASNIGFRQTRRRVAGTESSSPGRAAVNSQGREPLDGRGTAAQALEGRQNPRVGLSLLRFCRPYGARTVAFSASRGSRPWLFTVAAPRLDRGAAVALALLAGLALLASPLRAADEEIRTVLARQQETGFGNLVAEGIRAATRAEIAFVAGGEFREATLRSGGDRTAVPVTLLEDPETPLVLLSLKGESIREAIELGLQQYPKPGKAFLHVAGLRVAFGARAVDGRRALNVSVQGQPLVTDRPYRVAMTRTLAIGAFGYFRLWPEGKTAGAESVTVGQALQRALANGTLTTRGDGRMLEKSGE